MSEVTADSHETHEGELNGTYGEGPEPTTSVDVEGDLHGGDEDDEESDDYDDNEVDYEEERQIVGDESDDEDEEDEEDGEHGDIQEQGTLTHLLIANPNAAVDGEDIDDEEEDEEDEDEDYVEEPEEQDNAPPVITSNIKKRPIDEVADEDEDTQGSKKVKA